ncbi:MAG: response regulator transcription factor [Betaproteobacteria bacterium]|nr:response regulator transcription factor [Betaproteobacteria bacterium]
MIRIVIADDHAMVRGGLKQIIATTPDIEVVGEATQGHEVLTLLRQTTFDLLLLDMTMPGLSGVELIRRLHEEKPDLPMLILSMHNEVQVVTRALKAGASGYVTKDSEPEILLQAIRKIVAGGKYIDPTLVDAMVFDARDRDSLPHEDLSERELQILKMIAAGGALNEIASQLCLSPKTISTHKMRLMQKLGVDNNADLIRYATTHGLVSD